MTAVTCIATSFQTVLVCVRGWEWRCVWPLKSGPHRHQARLKIGGGTHLSIFLSSIREPKLNGEEEDEDEDVVVVVVVVVGAFAFACDGAEVAVLSLLLLLIASLFMADKAPEVLVPL